MRFAEMCKALDQVCHWHRQVAGRFEQAAHAGGTGSRARLLFDYMASRHEVFAHGVEEFMTECPAVERGSWAPHADYEAALDELLGRLETESINLEQAEDVGMAVGRFFVDLFTELEKVSDSNHVREVFSSLKAGADKEQEKLARNVNLMLDF
jgi:hypothetical protein